MFYFQPFVVHRITKTKLEWRIRNLPYEVEVYQLSVDPVEKCIVVRTTNKKYYKKIPILELQRLNLIPDESYLKYSHSYNTLIITVSNNFIEIFTNLKKDKVKRL